MGQKVSKETTPAPEKVDLTSPKFEFLSDKNDTRLSKLSATAPSSAHKVFKGLVDLSRRGLLELNLGEPEAEADEMIRGVRDICLAFNRFRQFPEAIATICGDRCSPLTRLNMTANHLHSTPELLLQLPGPVARYARLKSLLLSRNMLNAADVDRICPLVPSLEVLDLSFNPLQKFPEQLRHCRQLRLLDVRNAALEEVAWGVVGGFTELEVLPVCFSAYCVLFTLRKIFSGPSY